MESRTNKGGVSGHSTRLLSTDDNSSTTSAGNTSQQRSGMFKNDSRATAAAKYASMAYYHERKADAFKLRRELYQLHLSGDNYKINKLVNYRQYPHDIAVLQSDTQRRLEDEKDGMYFVGREVSGVQHKDEWEEKVSVAAYLLKWLEKRGVSVSAGPMGPVGQSTGSSLLAGSTNGHTGVTGTIGGGSGGGGGGSSAAGGRATTSRPTTAEEALATARADELAATPYLTLLSAAGTGLGGSDLTKLMLLSGLTLVR
jgi:hypothetical protein